MCLRCLLSKISPKTLFKGTMTKKVFFIIMIKKNGVYSAKNLNFYMYFKYKQEKL